MAKITDLTQAEESALALEFAESIHAGFPSPAADHTGERIDMTHEMTPNPDTTFYARVEGDSMRDAGILDGDVVVVDRSLEPKNGDFIIAYIDDEYTLKEFKLDPANDSPSVLTNLLIFKSGASLHTPSIASTTNL